MVLLEKIKIYSYLYYMIWTTTLMFIGMLLLIFIPIIICSAIINYFPKSKLSSFIRKHIITDQDLDPPSQL